MLCVFYKLVDWLCILDFAVQIEAAQEQRMHIFKMEDMQNTSWEVLAVFTDDVASI